MISQPGEPPLPPPLALAGARGRRRGDDDRHKSQKSQQNDVCSSSSSSMSLCVLLLALVLLVLLPSPTHAGLLKVGRPLPWHVSLPHLRPVRRAGVRQFLNIYHRLKDIRQDDLLWGEEVEYGIFKVDRTKRHVWLSLRGKEVMESLIKKEQDYTQRSEGCNWHPEFGSWMVESTPSRPYTGYATDLLRVESNMRLRRKRLLTSLDKDEVAPTVVAFPLMGVGEFTDPAAPPGGPVSDSSYVPDSCINPHPRFGTLVKNIRTRRGSRVDIRVPLFKDEETPEFKEWDETTRAKGAPRPYIDMDAMAFGMGCCCLQVTFQARDIDESRYMHDQLAVLAPVLMALTAASPIFKGRLADTDARWSTIAGAVDDRTPAERGELKEEALKAAADSSMAGDGVKRLYKSRYDSISTFIYSCGDEGKDGEGGEEEGGNPKKKKRAVSAIDRYNDIPCEVDDELQTMLLEGGVDAALARHIAHLFVRDPLVIFDDAIEVDDTKTTEHFENIQSTNWQTVRWKPPPQRTTPKDPHIGWRTEFRSMEIQLTDFENAAFTVFVILLTRVILTFDLSLYLPLSKVDDNMGKAHQRDGLLKEKFWFRKHLAPPLASSSSSSSSSPTEPEGEEAKQKRNKAFEGAQKAGFVASSSCQDHIWQGTVDEYELMTVEEILNGKGDYFLGLIPLCNMYLDYIGCDRETFRRVSVYLDFIARRGSGETMTTAAWMRKFVTKHPEYQRDSVVSPSIAYDLMMECKRIGEGRLQCPEVLGNVQIDPIFPGEAYDVYLSGTKMGSSERAELLRAYRKREPFHTKREGAKGGKGGKEGETKGRGKKGGGKGKDDDEFFHYN